MRSLGLREKSKRFKTITKLLVLLLLGVLILAGCAPSSRARQEKWTIRLSNGLAVNAYQNTELLPSFAKEIQEKTGSKVTVELYPAGQLFGHIETVNALAQGGVEMGFVSLNHFSGYSRALAFNDYAFLVNDIDAWVNNYDETFKMVDQILTAKGMKLLALVPYSSTVIVSRKPIEKPEDAKGLRIRGISDPFFDCIKAWGGVPAAMTPEEAYDAMSKGALDGLMTGWDSVKARRFYEVASCVSGPTAASIWAIVTNLNYWQSLPEDVRQVIQQAANNAKEKGIVDQKKVDAEAIEFLKSKGMRVKVFTAQEVQVWRQATKSAYDLYLQRATEAGEGEIAKKILDTYLK